MNEQCFPVIIPENPPYDARSTALPWNSYAVDGYASGLPLAAKLSVGSVGAELSLVVTRNESIIQIARSSGDLPASIAAMNQSGRRPLPVHVWVLSSGLAYLGVPGFFGFLAIFFFGVSVGRPPGAISARENPCALAAFSAAAKASFISVLETRVSALSISALSFSSCLRVMDLRSGFILVSLVIAGRTTSHAQNSVNHKRRAP